MRAFRIEPATVQDLDPVLAMALELWPDEAAEEMRAVLREVIGSPTQTLLLARSVDDDARPVAFATLSLRTDYVEGSDSSPVGYLEGIFIQEAARGHGIGRALVAAGEAWAAALGCTEMGSDAYLTNTQSHAFHTAVGFREAGRLVAFIKRIAP